MRRTTYPIISELQYELRIRNWFRGLVFPDVRSTLKVAPKPRLPCFLLAASALCSELCGSLQQLGTQDPVQFLRGSNLDLFFKTGSCLFWTLKTSDTKNIYCKFLIGIRRLISGPPLPLQKNAACFFCGLRRGLTIQVESEVGDPRSTLLLFLANGPSRGIDTSSWRACTMQRGA